MTHNNPYDIVREACVKANPEIELRVPVYGDGHTCTHHPDDPCHTAECYKIPDPEIRLGDVLLALSPTTTTQPNPNIFIRGRYICVNNIHWDLLNDSLEWHRNNKPETVAWLAELLTNN